MTSSSEERLQEATARVGDVIDGRFELCALAASGGMGYVYRARDRSGSESVALKVLASDFTDAPRFTHEAEILARIDHPGVVRYIAHGALPRGDKYLVMEWLEGGDLSKRLLDGVLNADETVTVALGIMEALAAAHARGVIHRDLKPSNVFLVEGRLTDVRLLDFGIARALSHGDATMTAELVGTPAYMAPEQVRGGAIDRRVDLYGLGALMFRCLTGEPPFGGSHELAVLAKILLEPPRSVRDFATDVPQPLAALITKLLSKEPSDRPASANEVKEALMAQADARASEPFRVATAVTAREQRVASVVMCASGLPGALTMPESGAAREETRVRQAIAERGGRVDVLPRGAWLVTIPNASSPTEQTIRAARCALTLKDLRPSSALVVATGKIVLAGERHMGEVIDRAATTLFAGAPQIGSVHIDTTTAELLEGKFRIEGDGEWRVLVGEIEALTPARTLLGKPARFIGRDHPLAMISATLAASRAEPRACAALVIAPPGLGKTRLVHEILQSLAGAANDVTVLFANGDATRAASPFAVASQLVLRRAGSREGDRNAKAKIEKLVAADFSGEQRERMRDLLAEICGLQTSTEDAGPALRAARSDLSVMADTLSEAFIDWLRVEASKNALVLVVEDLHWADAASVRLLERAFRALADRPVFLLATSRPESDVRLSQSFKDRGLVEITLGPLSAQASEKLVRAALGDRADDDLVAALVRRAAGHPFHLEELVRASARGRDRDALPDSVLGMVQARLDDLEPRSRRVLRAASVFGERFWAGGLAALLGDEVSTNDARVWLFDLVEQELVTEERNSPWPNEHEYRFRHALLRDAAYATLTEPDRVLAHRRAANWLEKKGEQDSALLAEHYFRGESPGDALTHSLRAAATAMHRNDVDEALRHAARAHTLGASKEQDGSLRAIEAEASYWRGDLATACDHAFEASRELSPESPAWFDAMSIAIGALGQRGQNDDVAAWLDRVTLAPSSPDSRCAHAVALCRGIAQLVWAHHQGHVAPARDRLDAITKDADLPAFEMGWVHRARGESAWVTNGDLGAARRELDRSCESFERAHAVRALCLTRINAASLAGWSGDTTRAFSLLEQSLAQADRLSAAFLRSYASAVHGLMLAYARDERAERVMRAAATGVKASPRLFAVSHLIVGSLALQRGDFDTANADAIAASALDVVDDLRCACMALSARVMFARGDTEGACALADEAARLERGRPDLELFTGMAAITAAQLDDRAGRHEDARAALLPCVARLARVCATLESPERRAAFWQRPLANAEISELAQKLQVDLA